MTKTEIMQKIIKKQDENGLYQCPYERAARCNLKDPCLECETFGDYLNGGTIIASLKSQLAEAGEEKECSTCKHLYNDE